MKKMYYLTLDTETCTLPFANTLCKNSEEKKKIAIAKPLVYDIGWTITDRQGNIVKSINYLVQETFFVPNVFNTGYYSNKRPIYMNMLANNEILVDTWNNIVIELINDMNTVNFVCAYNACFDFKKAIPFTEKYIKALYSVSYNEWEKKQYKKCQDILKGADNSKNPKYLEPIFELRDNEYPIVDLWELSCDRLINETKYKNFCLENNHLTNSAQFFKTSAETSFQYLTKDSEFIEDHTALSDALIEAQILTKCLKKGKLIPNITAFPFRTLGTTKEYVMTPRGKKYIDIVISAYENYLEQIEGVKSPRWVSKISNEYEQLLTYANY